MSVLSPDHLLDQADRLLVPAAGGAPRQADLKRAISSAYYALFHAVVAAAADDFVGSTRRASLRYALLYRSVDHRSLRLLCEVVKKDTPPAKYVRYIPANGFGPDLIAFAAAVVELQEARHMADYDPLFRVRASDAILVVEMGRAALARFRAADPAEREVFLSLTVFAPRST